MSLSLNQIRDNARKFSLEWKDEVRERAESQTFWNEFFAVFGVNRRRVGIFEAAFKKLKGTQGFIDVYWPKKLICEQKSRGEDLTKATTQALEYLQSIAKVAEDDLPRYVLVCDFERLQVLDVETQQHTEILVANLAEHIELFGFISGYETAFIQEQKELNIQAALRMGRLHDQLKDNGYDGHELRVMLIRLLFCLFAEDTQIFNKHQFYQLIARRTCEDGSDLAGWISQLFDTLNREKRLKKLDEQLAAFPYINGELFKEPIAPAAFDAAMRQELLDACSTNWKTISPEIFGALFQSVMDKDERRSLGAHYTSEDNILKVISSLFLDDLRAEFAAIKTKKQTNIRATELEKFHQKLAHLTFLDPACGCGNFLVVAYRELRLLELELIEQMKKDTPQLVMDVGLLIRCNVDQFYGIEIEEFPAQIARVAMWLVDHQMNLLVSERFGMHYARIPLKHSAHILHGNALQVDWPITDFIMGNPPFVGAKLIDATQRAAFDAVMHDVPKSGLLDFVSAWYVKSALIIKNNPNVRCALVSTNSICQGEQVGVLWSWMLRHGMHIQFAHRTFVWQSAAKGKAAVHCVIVGFGTDQKRTKTIFEYENGKGLSTAISAKNINPYLVDALDFLLDKRRKPICSVPEISFGNMPNDGGNFFVEDADLENYITSEKLSKKYIKPFLGAYEFINGKKKWCLWFEQLEPKDLQKMPISYERVQAVQKLRGSSTREATKKLALTPSLFGEIRQPKTDFILIPRVSSENREYIPMGIFSSDHIVGDTCLAIANAQFFHLGIVQSHMHMAWVKSVCGRLKSDFRYSNEIVYNNFPWPLDPTDKQKTAIETAAQAILDARAQYPESSLADLYDPLTMPVDLLKAHQKLDKAVDAAYGKTKFASEAERVAFLFELYQHYIEQEAQQHAASKTQKSRKTS